MIVPVNACRSTATAGHGRGAHQAQSGEQHPEPVGQRPARPRRSARRRGRQRAGRRSAGRPSGGQVRPQSPPPERGGGGVQEPEVGGCVGGRRSRRAERGPGREHQSADRLRDRGDRELAAQPRGGVDRTGEPERLALDVARERVVDDVPGRWRALAEQCIADGRQCLRVRFEKIGGLGCRARFLRQRVSPGGAPPWPVRRRWPRCAARPAGRRPARAAR